MPAATDTSRVAVSERPGRIESLDVLRGLMLVASILSSSWFVANPPAFNVHAVWDETPTAIDWIFPIFVTLSGCGLAFAYRNRVGWGSTLRRTAVLLLVGLGYNAIVQWSRGGVSWDTLKFTGPLTLYAVLVLVIGLLHLLLRGWRAWLLFTVGLSLALTTALWTFAQGCPGGELSRACNPSGRWDPQVFGAARIYRAGTAGHDPEGIFGMLGALCSAAVGATGGHLLLARRRGSLLGLLARAATCLVLWLSLAWGLGQAVPAMKRLWTPPFALGISGLVVLALVGSYLLLDRRARPPALDRILYAPVAMGRNALLMYFGSHALMVVLVGVTVEGGRRAIDVVAGAVSIGGHEQATWSVLLLATFMGGAVLLHRAGVYLRP